MNIDDARASLRRYADRHIETGGFLRSVLENNLMEAMGRADETSRAWLFEICSYVYNELPSPCHGSPEAVAAGLATAPTGAAQVPNVGAPAAGREEPK